MGAKVINDVTPSSTMAQVVAEAGGPVILMHGSQWPDNRAVQHYDVISTVKAFFEKSSLGADQGIKEEQIWTRGWDSSSTEAHYSFEIVCRLPELGFPCCWGPLASPSWLSIPGRTLSTEERLVTTWLGVDILHS